MSERVIEPIPFARLEGPHVVVRTTTEDDAAEYLRYFRENREHLSPWERPFDADFLNLEARRKRLALATEARIAGREVFMAMVKKELPMRLIGLIQVRTITPGPLHGCAIGYSIDHREEGRGLMHEGVNLVCKWLFDVLGLHRVEAGYSTENHRSAHLLEKLGFEKEGRQRAYLWLNGRWHDHVSTSLINDAWKERS